VHYSQGRHSTQHAIRAGAAPLNVVSILRERGLIQDTTSNALEAACAGPLKVYCGFDPTAESLHLGNLLGIIVLAWFRKCGHEPMPLIGGATGRVGDPSGRSSERPVLSETELERNVQGGQQTLPAFCTAMPRQGR
jgi:tyrosyl-tRNA synthetase